MKPLVATAFCSTPPNGWKRCVGWLLWCLGAGSFSLLPARADVEIDESIRTALQAAMDDDFEWIRDRVVQHSDARGGARYWLVYLKPKKTGHFTLTHAFHFTHGHSHPEEGENEHFIQVNRTGARRHSSGPGVHICLGDTVMFPLRLDEVDRHRFTLKSRYDDGTSADNLLGTEARYGEIPPPAAMENPLDSHLEYLGSVTSEGSSSKRGGERTLIHTSIWKVRETPGRFNLEVSSRPLVAADEGKPDSGSPRGIPVLIVEPGTPLTVLASHMNEKRYSDQRRFSAQNGYGFATSLLVLQAGDVFAVDYATSTLSSLTDDGEKDPGDIVAPPPFVRGLPFALNPGDRYNAWLMDTLPGL